MPDLNRKLIESYKNWLIELARQGRTLWLLTMELKSINTPPRTFLNIMEREVRRIYRTLLTRIVRKPKRASLDDLPVLVGCPDRPVQKRKLFNRPEHLVPNCGSHYHAVLALPPRSRLREPLDEHIQNNLEHYKGPIILDLDTRLVTDVEGRLADYVLKQLKRGAYTSDDVLVLPQHPSELPSARALDAMSFGLGA